MNGHVVATTLGQMTGLLIALAVFLPLVLIFFGVFKFTFKLAWAIISFPLKVLFSIIKALLSVFKQSKNSKEIIQHEKQSTIQQGIIETPEYIGLLTKIDKKQIAEDYLDEKRRKKNGRKK